MADENQIGEMRSSGVIDRISMQLPTNFELRLLLLPLALVIGGIAVVHWWLSSGTDFDEASIPTVTSLGSPLRMAVASTTLEDEQPGEIVVHVAGEVLAPGVLRLPPGSRIADAIEAAGGVTNEADVHRLNLAQTVYDGTSFTVPSQGQPSSSSDVRAQLILPELASADGTSGSIGGAEPKANSVNINSADATELQTLTGVGPATAEAIVSWRKENGSFQTLEQLLAVPGIGPAKLDAIRPGVVVQ